MTMSFSNLIKDKIHECFLKNLETTENFEISADDAYLITLRKRKLQV